MSPTVSGNLLLGGKSYPSFSASTDFSLIVLAKDSRTLHSRIFGFGFHLGLFQWFSSRASHCDHALLSLRMGPGGWSPFWARERGRREVAGPQIFSRSSTALLSCVSWAASGPWPATWQCLESLLFVFLRWGWWWWGWWRGWRSAPTPESSWGWQVFPRVLFKGSAFFPLKGPDRMPQKCLFTLLSRQRGLDWNKRKSRIFFSSREKGRERCSIPH